MSETKRKKNQKPQHSKRLQQQSDQINEQSSPMQQKSDELQQRSDLHNHSIPHQDVPSVQEKKQDQNAVFYDKQCEIFNKIDIYHLLKPWVMVMRHGHRTDDLGNFNSPPDPNPSITANSRREARCIGQSLAAVLRNKIDLNDSSIKNAGNNCGNNIVDYINKVLVVSSPFLRCKQTALALVAGLYGNCGNNKKVYYDARISEMFNSDTIKGVDSKIDFSNSEDNSFIQSISVKKDTVLPFVDQEVATTLPKWEENKAEAYTRFQKAFLDITTKAAKSGYNVIFVTHGDVVNASLKLFYPLRSVYSTEYLCYLMFENISHRKYKLLLKNDVEWLEDDYIDENIVDISDVNPNLIKKVSRKIISIIQKIFSFF